MGHLIIGLGSGRSGTASLASLIDSQPGGLCFHEMNPSCAVFEGNPQSHLNIVGEMRAILAGGARNRLSIDYSREMSIRTFARLQALDEVNVLGDIAYYYLTYVEEILDAFPETRFVCLKRDREETVDSWLKKTTIKRWRSLWLADRMKSIMTRTPFHTSYNHWMEHDGSEWRLDPVWDSCFPKYRADSKREAIGMYWDAYYATAEALQERHPDSFRIFATQALSSPEGQRKILDFVGLSDGAMRLEESVHLHRSD